jgi:hypothetical protein
VTPYHNTICLQCNIVCHERCSLAETTKIGENVFRHCTVMDSGQCTVCFRKCSCDMHYHDRRLIRCVPRTLKFAISALSDKDSQVENGRTACEIEYKTIQERKRVIEQSLQEQFNKVRDACLCVQNNCQSFNIAGELCVLVNLLKNDMNSFTSSSLINNVTKFIEKLEILAHTSSITRSKESPTLATERKIRTSKGNQSQTTTVLAEFSLLNDDASIRTQQSTSDYSSSQKYAEYTTEQLIALTRKIVEKYIPIARELDRRCKGTSIGYLSSLQLLTLCEYYSSSRLLRPDELVRLHSQLQLEIQESTNSNPSEISSVPIQKLLHLTAVTLCLHDTDKYE